MTRPTPLEWMAGVVQRNDRDLKRYLARRVHSSADAEDLAQEVYLRLLRVKRKELIRSPEAFLFRIASNAIYEWRLLARNRLPHSQAALDSLECSQSEPATEVWRAELGGALSAALQQLSPKCRACVLLHRREQLTYSEVGQRLGISVGMVKKYLAQGLALCREEIGQRLGSSAEQERE